MGTKVGKDFTSLIHELEKNAPAYNVFQAIFMAEKIINKLVPDRDEEKLDQKGMYFRPYEMYVFPPTDIRNFVKKENGVEFVLNFMGLYGVNSPFPRCYHEQVAIQQQVHGEGNVPLQNFLDIFNNRFYWLYYCAWKKYRHYLKITKDVHSKSNERIFSFIGRGPNLRGREIQISPLKLLQVSGLLTNRIRSKLGLQILLQEFFPSIEIKIREHIPSQIELSEILRVGKEELVLGENSILGRSTIDYMSKICIQMGPMDFGKYLDFLPGGKKVIFLKEILDLYLNDSLEYDIQFFVKTDQIIKIPWNDSRLRLGQSIWLGQPKEDLVKIYYSYEKLGELAS